MSPAISIVIPAYQEAARLPRNLGLLADYLRSWDYEVLVIVEKSHDQTLQLCREAVRDYPNFKVIDNQVKRGKGFAVRTGMLQARGELIFFMDADLSTPLKEIESFTNYFKAHPEVDILIGNRRHHKSEIRKPQGFWRRHLSQLFNWVVRALVMPGGIGDTQCGFKAFRKEAACEIFQRQKLDSFSFDLEVLLLAQAMGYKIVDLPINWADENASTLSLFNDGWSMLRDLVFVRRLVARSLKNNPPTQW